MRYAILLVVLVHAFPLFSQDPHFHETGGFGTDGVYGLDGEVYRVTNLNNTGEGSLRFGLEMTGPRLIVFEVGGIIDLEGQDLVIQNGSVTVAGQTAPTPGITLIKGGLRVSGNEVLLQHLTIRPGDGGYTEPVGWEPDGFAVSSANVVFDHCSVSWAIDENMSVSNGGNNVTFYRCIIAEGLSNSIHAKGEHSCGSLVYFNSKNISIIGCYYAHNYRRHPRYVDGSEMLFANNVVYNYGIYASHVGANVGAGNPDDPGIGDFIGNAYFKGADGWDDYMLESHKGDFDKNNPPANGMAFLEDNLGLDRFAGTPLIPHDENITLLSESHVKPEAVLPYDAYENIELVLKHAGSRPSERSAEDARIVQSLIDGTGSVIDSQTEVGGYPDYPDSSRLIEVIPGTSVERRAWLDSISTSFESAEDLDVLPLYTFIDEYLKTDVPVFSEIRLKCYPQPVTSHLIITFQLNEVKRMQLYLVDMTGRKIDLQRDLNCNAGFNEKRISLSGHSIPEGVYLLVLTDGISNFSEKIILKRE